ncbi:General odorant-binding protein 56d [Papilio machaon]|uniref:General odorant-binding protein 56d n=1 Tax=Papilio machaon TaxID=76193 RepID=A0A194R2F3_PAPMA|nr:General odorant-binding protein 56d [Papilio machaon]
MNSLLLLCFVLSFATIEAHTVHLSHSQKEKAHLYIAECMKESGVKSEVLVEAKKGVFEEDEPLKKFTLCFFRKSGIINDEGKLNVAEALAKLPSGVDKANAEKLLEECKKKTGKNHADTAFEIYKCYYHGTKEHILL